MPNVLSSSSPFPRTCPKIWAAEYANPTAKDAIGSSRECLSFLFLRVDGQARSHSDAYLGPALVGDRLLCLIWQEINLSLDSLAGHNGRIVTAKGQTCPFRSDLGRPA